MKILVVDDKQSVLTNITEMLSKLGYFSYTACNGLDAFEKAQNNDYDLFVVDHLMPVMNGVQLIKNLKKFHKTSHLPILFMTTQDLDSVSQIPEANLFDKIMSKPICEKDLLEFVAQARENTPNYSSK